MKEKIIKPDNLHIVLPISELEKLPVMYLYAQEPSLAILNTAKSKFYRSLTFECHPFYKPISKVFNYDEHYNSK